MTQVVWHFPSLSNSSQTNAQAQSLTSGSSSWQMDDFYASPLDLIGGELYEAQLKMKNPTAYEMSQNDSLIPDGIFYLNVSNSEGYNLFNFSIRNLIDRHITTTVRPATTQPVSFVSLETEERIS